MLIEARHPTPNTSNLIFVIRLHALFVSRRMNSRTCVMVEKRERERDSLDESAWYTVGFSVRASRYARIVSDCSYCEMVREISS